MKKFFVLLVCAAIACATISCGGSSSKSSDGNGVSSKKVFSSLRSSAGQEVDNDSDEDDEEMSEYDELALAALNAACEEDEQTAIAAIGSLANRMDELNGAYAFCGLMASYLATLREDFVTRGIYTQLYCQFYEQALNDVDGMQEAYDESGADFSPSDIYDEFQAEIATY